MYDNLTQSAIVCYIDNGQYVVQQPLIPVSETLEHEQEAGVPLVDFEDQMVWVLHFMGDIAHT